MRANEPPATVLAKPIQFAVKRRYSKNEQPESLVLLSSGSAVRHIFALNSYYAALHPARWQVSVHDSKNQEYSGQSDADGGISYLQKDDHVTISIAIALHLSGFFLGYGRF